MAISPASAANYDWFLDTLCRARPARRPSAPASRSTRCSPREIDAALAQPSTVLFHPYLFGSPHGPVASAGFLGLRGWHDRGTLLRAVLEGIAFNHRVHVDALRDGFAVARGAADRRRLAQPGLRADVRRHPRRCRSPSPTTDEAAAWGAALCAGAGVGLFASPHDDPRDLARLGTTYAPTPRAAPPTTSAIALFCRVAATLAPLWPEIERLAGRGHDALRDRLDVDVVILGAGINGAGLFRDLCEQGVRCLIVDKADFGSGTSAAPSRLIHGGLKYLETGEFGLVAQSTLERNLLLQQRAALRRAAADRDPDLLLDQRASAPALRTLAGSTSAPRSRGALLIKIGLALYDFYGARSRVMPRHRLVGRRRALRETAASYAAHRRRRHLLRRQDQPPRAAGLRAGRRTALDASPGSAARQLRDADRGRRAASSPSQPADGRALAVRPKHRRQRRRPLDRPGQRRPRRAVAA